jgi:peroxiredoxin
MRSLPSMLLLLLSLICAVMQAGAAEAGPDAGKQALSFELPDLSSKKVPLSGYRGKVVLLNFWSTLCAPCTAEMPSLNRLQTALSNDGFQVIAVSIDTAEKPVKDFVREKDLAFPVLLDRDKEVYFDQFAGPGLPVSYLIDRTGIIVEIFTGPRDWDSREMKDRIMKLLKGR